MKRIVLIAALAALALPAAAEGPTPHPYFNDGGTLSWSTALADAQAAARKGGRAIFVEFGREA